MEFLSQAQKDQALAETMVKNGLAISVPNALEKIKNQREQEKGKEQIAAKKAQEQTDVFAGQSAPQAAPEPRPVAAPVQNIDPDLNARLTKIEGFLEKFDKFFSKFYEETKQKLSDLTKQMNAISSKQQSMNEPTLKEIAKDFSEQPEKQEQPAAQQQAAPAKPQEESKPHPKTGSQDPNKYNIAEIFNNAGNKMNRRMQQNK